MWLPVGMRVITTGWLLDANPSGCSVYEQPGGQECRWCLKRECGGPIIYASVQDGSVGLLAVKGGSRSRTGSNVSEPLEEVTTKQAVE